ncbi:SDR family oxidoreductase [Chitinophaga sp. SYP-B3965]|uniref:SDR family oxidoreductase n=1 Tax=Chitinophaga sp. SYP-B3965 TaxID=2663120 RepID=UPI001299AF24|nr:SDR family oxidoreductase [Chitinophaga sp. SYP-B3965]MRG43858.1 SDR family oxidoreductase [Chitinophaga sp. SYP-B3965]
MKNKKVIILGGSSGLGLATAKAAAAEGAQVIIVSGNQQRIDEALKELPGNCSGYAVDLSKEENIQRFFEQAGAFDHLIYTAGENLNLANISDTVLEEARSFFNIRFWGAFAAVKYASPHINPGGSIGLTSGIASTRPGKGWSVASSICGAMEGFVRAMAVELAPLRVNCVVPGVVRTNLWNSMALADRDALYRSVGDSMLVKRVGEAEDIAMAFLYLMKQSFGTGQQIIIDGGAVLV